MRFIFLTLIALSLVFCETKAIEEVCGECNAEQLMEQYKKLKCTSDTTNYEACGGCDSEMLRVRYSELLVRKIDSNCNSVGSVDTEPSVSIIVEKISNSFTDNRITYRLYVQLENEGDAVISIYGLQETPLKIQSSSDPKWYQNDVGNDFGAPNSNFFNIFPGLEYDTYLTIGGPGVCGGDIQTANFDNYNFFQGTEDLIIDTEIGAVMFIIPNSACVDEKNRVMIAQLTTGGGASARVHGVVNIQIRDKYENSKNYNGLSFDSNTI